ncbi:Protein KIN-9 c [Aphelenchoides avenae]|nr:Protein KIN-9 c [Aphelenchus avenae]
MSLLGRRMKRNPPDTSWPSSGGGPGSQVLQIKSGDNGLTISNGGSSVNIVRPGGISNNHIPTYIPPANRDKWNDGQDEPCEECDAYAAQYGPFGQFGPPYPYMPPMSGTRGSSGGSGSSSAWKEDAYPSSDKSWGPEGSGDNGLAIGLGLGLGLPLLLCCMICLLCIWRWWRKRYRSFKAIYSYVTSSSPMVHSPPSSGPTHNYISSTYLSPSELRVPTGSGPPASENTVDLWEMEKKNVIIHYDKKLGTGAFCNVFQGKIIGDAAIRKVYRDVMALGHYHDCDVAIKMLPSFADDIARSDFKQEINFMKSLHYHPHLVSMLGYVSDQRSPLLVVEYCSKGDLLHFIRDHSSEIIRGYQNSEGIKLRDLVSFGWQISNGLEYLNSMGCIHRDVAARNVIVDHANVCKIGDFGLCRLTDSLLYTARGGRLPLRWMAPESLRSFEYSFKSDVWSYGVVLYELFSFGAVPFSSLENSKLLEHLDAGHRLERPTYCPPEIYQIMLSCWQHNPGNRPGFTEICANFVGILERATEYYGYLMPVPDEPSPDYDTIVV